MAVDEEFHPCIVSEMGTARDAATCKAISMTRLVIRVCARMCMNPRQYSGFGIGLPVLNCRTWNGRFPCA
jgi:hypothetical protein